MKKSELLRALQTEIARHEFGTFAMDVGNGQTRVSPGCPVCRKPFMTETQFVQHITRDVLPEIINRLSTESSSDEADVRCLK